MKFVDIGFGNLIAASKIEVVVAPDSAPVKRMISDARENGQLVDATYGRKTAAVIVTESDHVVLSALSPEEISERADTQ